MRRSLSDPFAETNRLQARLRSLLDEAFPGPVAAPGPGCWTPRAEVLAEADRITVALELPGVALEDIELHLRGNALTISGVRRREQPGEELLYCERPAGRFSRSFSLGFAPRTEEAKLEEGVLTVTLNR